MKAAIFGSSDPGELSHILEYAPFDLVLCADGGIRFARALSLKPDMLIGDSDSGGMAEEGLPFLELPVEKDMTDSEAALDCAIERGALEIFFFCCTGGRFDHFFANVFLLERASERGVRAVMADPLNEVRYLKDGELTVENDGRYSYLSLVPVDREALGVDITGVAFPLSGATLRRAATVGISNRMLGEKAVVRVKSGALLVILSRDPA